MDNRYFDTLKNWWEDLTFTALQRRGLAIVAALVLLISALFILRGSSEEVVAAPAPLEFESVTAQTVMVDVAGGVVRPGVYSLPLNARVFEAIKAAGGISPGADASDVNQARILRDGEQIYIYPKSATATHHGKAAVRKSGPIAINRASATEFEALDGIGPVLANRIVNYRKVNGPFTAIEDLLKVPGIGQSTFAKFKEKLRV